MDFEWDDEKERANRKKHRVDFRTASKMFLDPYVMEFEDLDAAGEVRFNAIGLVAGHLLFVTYTIRGEGRSFALYPPAERSRMKKGSTTSFRLVPSHPPNTDWREFGAMSDEERHQAALSDPDCPPATAAQLARARRVPTVACARS
jgi:uncharacterized DUF497 family protein